MHFAAIKVPTEQSRPIKSSHDTPLSAFASAGWKVITRFSFFQLSFILGGRRGGGSEGKGVTVSVSSCFYEYFPSSAFVLRLFSFTSENCVCACACLVFPLLMFSVFAFSSL